MLIQDIIPPPVKATAVKQKKRINKQTSKKALAFFTILFLILQFFAGLEFLYPKQAKAAGTIYYIDQSCTIGGTGTSQTCDGADGPFKTIAAAQAAVTGDQHGNSLLIKKGTPAPVYREQFTVGAYGTAAGQFTVGAYGSGLLPVINGSDLIASAWTGIGETISASPGANKDTCFVQPIWDGIYTNNMDFGNEWSDAGESENIGMRFLNVAVPKDATISSATISFVARTTLAANTVNMTILGEQNANPATFSTEDDFTGRTPTAATVPWNAVPAWTLGTTYTSPEIKTIVQEIVNLADWVSGHNLVIKANNNASSMGAFRRAFSYEIDPTKDPLLSVTFVSATPTTWQTALTTEPDQLFFNGTRGTKVASAALCNSTNKWYWASNILYVYSTSDPATAFTNPGIEASARNYNIQADGKTYITIQKIETKYANTLYGSGGINLINDCSNTIIEEVVSSYNWGAGIKVADVTGNHAISNVTIKNSQFYYNGQSGIDFAPWGASGTTVFSNGLVQSNISHHNCQDSATTYLAGIHFGTPAGYAAYVITNFIIEHNESYLEGKNAAGTIVAHEYSASGIHLDTTQSCIVRYNISHENAREGIFIENGDSNSIYYNIAWGNRDNPTQSYYSSGIVVGTSRSDLYSKTNLVYNNVSYDNEQGIYVYGFGNYTGGETVVGNILKNNISFSNGTLQFSAINGAQNAHAASGWGSGNIYTHNCFGVEVADFITWGTATPDTYDVWETAYGSSTFSVKSDPLFVSSSDFHLQPSSPAINAGVDVGLTSDYDSISLPRGAGFEIGAYEYPVPLAPTIGIPQSLTELSIRWNFTDNSDDETGFRLYDNNGALINSQATANLSFIDETGLSCNTRYSGRYVKAYNDYGESAASANAWSQSTDSCPSGGFLPPSNAYANWLAQSNPVPTLTPSPPAGSPQANSPAPPTQAETGSASSQPSPEATVGTAGQASSSNLPSPQSQPIAPFTKYLRLSQVSADVKRLQIFLNQDPDTQIAKSGAGSPGKETNFFGRLTKAAVIKFQEKYTEDILAPWKLTKGTGFVGRTTTAKINEMMGR